MPPETAAWSARTCATTVRGGTTPIARQDGPAPSPAATIPRSDDAFRQAGIVAQPRAGHTLLMPSTSVLPVLPVLPVRPVRPVRPVLPVLPVWPAGLFLVPLLVPLLGTLLACDDPRLQRRADALDIAGLWQLRAENTEGPAEQDFILRFDDEGSDDDHADVVARAESRVPFGAEAPALEQLDVDDRRAIVDAMVLGDGPNAVLEEADGGENVSLDGGESATVLVVSEPYFAVNRSVDDDATFRWGLALEGTATSLAGTFFVVATTTRSVAGDTNGEALETTRLALPVVLERP